MFCSHKPKLKNSILLLVPMVVKTTRKKETSETVKQDLLNSLKENYKLEEPEIDATADTKQTH